MPFAGKYGVRAPKAAHDEFCHDGAQINHGLMRAENGFFGAVRQENPTGPIFAVLIN
jgi:hypothetical protein